MKKKTIQLTSDIWLAWWGNMTWLTLWRFLKIWKQFDNSEFVYNFEMLWKFWQVAILATLTTLTNFGNFLHFWTILTIVWQFLTIVWRFLTIVWKFLTIFFLQFLHYVTIFTILDKFVNFGQTCQLLTIFGQFRTILDNFDIWDNWKDSPGDLWHLRHWLQFWRLRTWILTIILTWQLIVTAFTILAMFWNASFSIFGVILWKFQYEFWVFLGDLRRILGKL